MRAKQKNIITALLIGALLAGCGKAELTDPGLQLQEPKEAVVVRPVWGFTGIFAPAIASNLGIAFNFLLNAGTSVVAWEGWKKYAQYQPGDRLSSLLPWNPNFRNGGSYRYPDQRGVPQGTYRGPGTVYQAPNNQYVYNNQQRPPYFGGDVYGGRRSSAANVIVGDGAGGLQIVNSTGRVDRFEPTRMGDGGIRGRAAELLSRNANLSLPPGAYEGFDPSRYPSPQAAMQGASAYAWQANRPHMALYRPSPVFPQANNWQPGASRYNSRMSNTQPELYAATYGVTPDLRQFAGFTNANAYPNPYAFTAAHSGPTAFGGRSTAAVVPVSLDPERGWIYHSRRLLGVGCACWPCWVSVTSAGNAPATMA